jgi:superoxide dismutase, Fe-Mn family
MPVLTLAVMKALLFPLVTLLPLCLAELSAIQADGSPSINKQTGIYLDSLPYEYNSLEPYLNEQTLRIHHDKHHAKVSENILTVHI